MLKFQSAVHFESRSGWPMSVYTRPFLVHPVVTCLTAADGHSEAGDADHNDASRMTDAIAAARIVDLEQAVRFLETKFQIT